MKNQTGTVHIKMGNPKKANTTEEPRKCVVCAHRATLRHFCCAPCLGVPEKNHNAVGAFLRGVRAYLENDDQCPYEEVGVERFDGFQLETYASVWAKFWWSGWESAERLNLRERVREAYGEDWELEWLDRWRRPAGSYLGHGRFTYDKDADS